MKTAIDIFSGAGGLSVGACMAGIRPIMAVEYDIHAVKTYKKNHSYMSHLVIHSDIKNVQPLDYTSKYPFILFGGPPCQGFSISNTKTRNIDNPNNEMYKEYIRFIKDLEPEWFLFENVGGFKSFNKGTLANEVEKKLQSLGYITSSSILNAADFGVPQKRTRFFIIGHKKTKGGIKFNFNSLKKQSHISVKDALSDLPILKNGEKLEKAPYKHPPKSNFSKLMRNKKRYVHQNFVTENKAHIIERYKVIKQGENWQAAKQKGLLGTYSNIENTHSGIYRRLEDDKPAVTIANYRKSMLIHPNENRGLSLREAARLQSFPDDFIFEGSLSFQQQQVGNAVPPLLARNIFDKIMEYSD